MTEIKPLTSLRLFFALWVVMRHLFIIHPGSPDNVIGFDPGPILNQFAIKGYLGVDAFFILSGFILSYTYSTRLQPFSGPVYRKFLVARIARIYPVHLFALAAFAAMVAADASLGHPPDPQQYGGLAFVLNVLLLQAWYILPDTTWNDVSWSISAEWFAYLCFPLALLYARSRASLWFKAGVPLLVLAVAEAVSDDHLSMAGGLIRLVPEFLIGAALYRLYVDMSRRAIVLPRWSGVAALALAAAGVLMDLDTLAVAGLGCLILSQAVGRDLFDRALSAPVLVYGGQISYCLYMVQRLVERGFRFVHGHWLDSLPASADFVIFLVMVIAAGAATHHLIEVPCRRWILERYQRRAARRELPEAVFGAAASAPASSSE